MCTKVSIKIEIAKRTEIELKNRGLGWKAETGCSQRKPFKSQVKPERRC